jgi:hypothetical protein
VSERWTGAALAVWLALSACSHRAGGDRPCAELDALLPGDAAAPDRPPGVPHPQLCGAVCNSLPPACYTPDCPMRCESMLADPSCAAESLALFDCQSRTSPDDYVCQDSRPRLKETVCAAETRAWIRCTLSQP